MALTSRSLFLYGFQVTTNNNAFTFRAVVAEPLRTCTIPIGYYSLTSLGEQISAQLQLADPARQYTVTVNRNVVGGTQNRVTIASNGIFFEMYFSTSTVSQAFATLIGFTPVDQTGFTTYTGSSSAGTAFSPAMIGYTFLSPDYMQKIQGNLNISASGDKEAIVYQIMQFWQVRFKYITFTEWQTGWLPLMTWAIQQRLLEYTPEISSPNTFYEGTLEGSKGDAKGLGFTTTEMLPDFPNLYDTDILKFRVRAIFPQTFS